MKISRKNIARQVRKEYKEAREWSGLRKDHCYTMMIDVSDGSIWSDCLDRNRWKEYESDTVARLNLYGAESYEPVERVEELYIELAVAKLKEAGHEIIF